MRDGETRLGIVGVTSVGLVMLLVLVGCGTGGTSAPSPTITSPTQLPTIVVNDTALPSPTLAPTQTPKPIIPNTATPAATATTVPTQPPTAIPNTPSPAPSPFKIGRDTAAQLTASGQWSNGGADIFQVTFMPDSQILAAREMTQTVLWDTVSGQRNLTLDGMSFARGDLSVAFSPDGKTLAAGVGQSGVGLWNTSDGKIKTMLAPDSFNVKSVAFTPDGKHLIVGTVGAPERIWDVASGNQVASASDEFGSYVLCVAVSPDGKWVAYGTGSSRGQGVLVFALPNLDNFFSLAIPVQGDMNTLAFSPDSQSLAVGTSLGKVSVVKVQGNTLAYTEAVGADGDGVESVTYSPNGELLAVGVSDGTVRLLDSADGKVLRALGSFKSAANGVAFSSDGETLAAGFEDGTIRVWKLGE